MLGTLDSIEAALAELEAKVSLLAPRVAPAEIGALQSQRGSLQQQLDASDDTEERDVIDHQIRSVVARLEGIEQAQKTLQRLRARRQIAENQLEQLHLDLSRAKASDVDLPDLTEPLQELRFEVDAAQEVEQLLGRASDRA